MNMNPIVYTCADTSEPVYYLAKKVEMTEEVRDNLEVLRVTAVLLGYSVILDFAQNSYRLCFLEEGKRQFKFMLTFKCEQYKEIKRVIRCSLDKHGGSLDSYSLDLIIKLAKEEL